MLGLAQLEDQGAGVPSGRETVRILGGAPAGAIMGAQLARRGRRSLRMTLEGRLLGRRRG